MDTAQIINQYTNHTGNIGDMHYKKIGTNMMDVFTGEGFATPSRYRKIKGAWVHVSGPVLASIPAV